MGLFSKFDSYPPDYFGEPNESFIRGLFSDEPVYSQPVLFGRDSGFIGGWSPDYPKYRNYEDYFSKNFPYPEKENYTSPIHPDGFDEKAYDEAMHEYYSNLPMY
jgi:hypothetical protein